MVIIMKIKAKEISYEKFQELETYKHKNPMKRSFLLASIIRIVSGMTARSVKFKTNYINIDKIDKKQPYLILMNHSSFIDMKIASKILYPKKYNIVCTDDGFVGKEFLMRWLGCISTKKYIMDPTLVKDMVYTIKKLNSSILLYPEACYSFDGTATPLPTNIGKCIKLLKVPVIMLRTHGAFHRDPLYNNLQLRKVNVSCDVELLASLDDVKNKNEKELMEIVNNAFSFDNYKWQQENKISIKEKFRADSLNRVLYKCPHCLKEDMIGKGETIKCKNCNAEYLLDEFGYLKNLNGDTIFNHIPDWYKWERECVKEEIINNTYNLDEKVEIYGLKDMKILYKLGSGRIIHNREGFKLIGCEGKLEYSQDTKYTYSLNSDLNWYELGDIISIGDSKARYYCLLKTKKDVVAKARLATEEMYKMDVI